MSIFNVSGRSAIKGDFNHDDSRRITDERSFNGHTVLGAYKFSRPASLLKKSADYVYTITQDGKQASLFTSKNGKTSQSYISMEKLDKMLSEKKAKCYGNNDSTQAQNIEGLRSRFSPPTYQGVAAARLADEQAEHQNTFPTFCV